MTTYIVDVDGTIADASRRRVWLQTKPRNWNAFFADIENDPVIWPVVDILQALYATDNILILASGRGEEYKEATNRWLSKNRIGYLFSAQYFRKTGDYRDDTVVKTELLEEMREDGFNPTIAFDDRKKVCQMWIEQGLFVFDVSQGNGDF